MAPLFTTSKDYAINMPLLHITYIYKLFFLFFSKKTGVSIYLSIHLSMSDMMHTLQLVTTVVSNSVDHTNLEHPQFAISVSHTN